MKLCMGCMNQMDDNLYTCPHCGFNETNLRQESYYLDPGTIVGGKYIIGKVLSYGGYTVAYMGYDAEYNQKVVIKEYLPSDFSTRSDGEKDITIYSGDALEQFQQGLTNFLNEANRIQSLQNPEGIAKVYDCIAENDTGYVITEYLEGNTLKEMLDSGKRYSVEEAKKFISHILRGLCNVHPMNIIHCDISPETIFITNTGEIKLLDFGATRYVTTANSKSLAIILKQGYAPEEQYRSRGVRGTWTDVYALGAVMYRMITGVVPQESVERALVDELKEPSKLGVSIPPSVENALMNAMNIFQEERTQSAKDFLNELNSANTKRIKVKKRKNDVGKFPVWAKVLVACLACAIVIGGIVIIRSAMGNSGSIVRDELLIVRDYTGKTKEEVRSILDESGFTDYRIEESMVFNADPNLAGTVFRQIPQAGSELKDGILKCYIYTNEVITYKEIRDLSAYSFAKKLGEESIPNDLFVQGDGNGEYFEILGIELSGGTVITKEDLQQNSSINVDEIVKVTYCANDFFYWESGLENYVGKNISEVEGSLFKIVNENSAPVSTGKKKAIQDSNTLVNDSYYSFVYDTGYVFKQKEDTFDTAVDERELEGEPIFHVVGEKLTYSGKTGNDLVQELKELGVDAIVVSGVGTQGIISVTVKDNTTEETLEYFTLDQDVTVQITAENLPQPKQKDKDKDKDKDKNKNEPTTVPVPPTPSEGDVLPEPTVKDIF